MRPSGDFSEPRKRKGFRFRGSELFVTLLLLSLPAYGVFSDVYETAEGYWVVSEVEKGLPPVRLRLPEGLESKNLLLKDRRGMRFPCTVVSAEDQHFLVFEPQQSGSFRLVYGFERVPGDYLPVTKSEDASLLENTRVLTFSTHRRMEEVEALQGMGRPLRLMGIYVAVSGMAVIAVCIWYRRELNR